ncbi:MAG TPA: GxxExxY protein [Tepidisphaeraceae bacterium]|nr:GxxExxY protein [Tepidisphaeraceae bacterium]
MSELNKELYLKEEVYAVIGAAIEVHKGLGCGFLEPVYQEAMCFELGDRRIPFKAECNLAIQYKGRILQKTYCADFICFEQLVVEIKALEKLYPRDEAQILNYLKATRLKVGVLINFGSHGKLEWKRFVL